MDVGAAEAEEDEDEDEDEDEEVEEAGESEDGAPVGEEGKVEICLQGTDGGGASGEESLRELSLRTPQAVSSGASEDFLVKHSISCDAIHRKRRKAGAALMPSRSLLAPPSHGGLQFASKISPFPLQFLCVCVCVFESVCVCVCMYTHIYRYMCVCWLVTCA